jgi:hypothetical protein
MGAPLCGAVVGFSLFIGCVGIRSAVMRSSNHFFFKRWGGGIATKVVDFEKLVSKIVLFFVPLFVLFFCKHISYGVWGGGGIN